MRNRFSAENNYKTTLLTSLSGIDKNTGSDIDEFSLRVETAPKSDQGWLIIDFSDVSKRDLIFYHRKVGDELFFYRKNRDLENNGTASIKHTKDAPIQMNNFAQLFNYIFSQVDDIGGVIKRDSTSVTVYGGEVIVNNTFTTIPDGDVTIPTTDATYRIGLDYTDNTFKIINDLNTFVGQYYADVIVSGSEVTTIDDKRTAALPLRFDPDVFEINGNGEVTFNGGASISDATNTTKGRVRLGTTTDTVGSASGPIVVPTSLLVSATAGSVDQGKIPMLNSSGKLDSSFDSRQYVSSSSGVSDDGKVPLLDSLGRLSSTFFDASTIGLITGSVIQLQAGETVSDGDCLRYGVPSTLQTLVKTSGQSNTQYQIGSEDNNRVRIGCVIQATVSGFIDRVTLRLSNNTPGGYYSNSSIRFRIGPADSTQLLSASQTYTIYPSSNSIPAGVQIVDVDLNQDFYVTAGDLYGIEIFNFDTTFAPGSESDTDGSLQSDVCVFPGAINAYRGGANVQGSYFQVQANRALDMSVRYKDSPEDTNKIYKASAAENHLKDFIGFASSGGDLDDNVFVNILSTSLSGLSFPKKYYLSDTPGSISTTEGTISTEVGKSISATLLKISS